MKTIKVLGQLNPIPSMNVEISAEIRGPNLYIYTKSSKGQEVNLVRISRSGRSVDVHIPFHGDTFVVEVE